jgi:hypothetical protein
MQSDQLPYREGREIIMKNLSCLAAFALKGVFFCLLTSQVAAQVSFENFTYHAPGRIVPSGDPGVRDRRIFFPDFEFPIRVGPDAGEDGQPLRAYANSQVFIPQGFGTDDARLYTYPWVDTLCESKHVGGSMPLCPNRRRSGHQGVDIRPNSPAKGVYDVLAVADGKVLQVTDFTFVRIRFKEANGGDTGKICDYEHLSPVRVRPDQDVRKGQVIGQVSNIMRGSGTSIHLHFQCETTHPDLGVKVKMPVYASLVAAYRKAWGLPESAQAGVLLRDPERELADSEGATALGPTCDEPLAAPVPATAGQTFLARYDHNCSEVGLTAGNEGSAKIVYIRPKASLAQAVQRNSVLASGTLSGTTFSGEAISFNKKCNDPRFMVHGTIHPSDSDFLLTGDREILNSDCQPASTKLEKLRFVKLPDAPPPVVEPQRPASERVCPFALRPGQAPLTVDGKEIPPKSERSCNFMAITVPGGLTFDQMPRYIREWPGVKRDILIDQFRDQIITFNSAESGIGIWSYWLMRRAVNGANLERKGFGEHGKPSLLEIARAMAGRDASETRVRRVYLAPYLLFASEYFGRTVDENVKIDLANVDDRWNLARTMFRLESGRTPVISRKQFRCGVRLGADVITDFDRAGAETDLSRPVSFTAFKGMSSYVERCETVPETDGPTEPGTGDATIAEIRQQLKLSQSKVGDLKTKLANLQTSYTKLTQAYEALRRLHSTPRSTPRSPGANQSVRFRQIVSPDIYQ